MSGTPSEGLDELDALVAEVMAEWQIPGPALAVVRKDEPSRVRCWGLRDIEAGTSVGPETLFPICSVTKSFTASGLALLVDDGKLEWDTPVREILPEFRLRVASEQATLRDLLTHRTGLPRHDWVHMGDHLDNAGMLAALRHLEPSKPFRSAYQYQNLMYLVAGIVLERISGQCWENFIRDRILLPLGMERATTSLEEMVERHSDYAAPHAVLDGVQRRIPARPINTRPGGGICASIAEMTAYMRFHLDPIAGRGSLRLSPGAVAELTAPQIFIKTQRRSFAVADNQNSGGFRDGWLKLIVKFRVLQSLKSNSCGLKTPLDKSSMRGRRGYICRYQIEAIQFKAQPNLVRDLHTRAYARASGRAPPPHPRPSPPPGAEREKPPHARGMITFSSVMKLLMRPMKSAPSACSALASGEALARSMAAKSSYQVSATPSTSTSVVGMSGRVRSPTIWD
jgi:CubicO group peptidase (beta-lactamase class C family)